MKRFCVHGNGTTTRPRKERGSGFFYAENEEEIQRWASRTGYVLVTVVAELLLFLIWLWR